MPRTCRSVNKEEREGSLRKEVTSPQGHLPVHAGAEGLLTQRGTGEAQHFSMERGGFARVIQSQQSCKAFQQGASPEVLSEHTVSLSSAGTLVKACSQN